MFVNKPSVTDYMPKFVKEKVRYATRISRYLEKLKHSKDNKTIKGSSTVTIDDVLIGEVWVCSGSEVSLSSW